MTRKQVMWYWFKQFFIGLNLFFVWAALLENVIEVYYDDAHILALPFTIITIFVWKRFSKKFNL